MLIKEIELNNFRIYKGVNRIELLPYGEKNIVVISGKNGYGKTTFLMSLVWCLYGRQMDKVDELYQKEITDKGGYSKYISNSLNRLAASNGELKFSVAVTFIDVKIPDVTCKEVKITRTFDFMNQDKVQILIDGHENELIQDLTSEGKNDGEEIFIRDFILPIEIAKFFFFDAEKIVSLAEINSPEQRRMLSKAYTEVLGIKKYEDLKDQLETLQDEYRKKSAKPQELTELNQIITDLMNRQIDIDDIETQVREFQDEKAIKSDMSNEIQRKLVQEGNHISIEQLNVLKKEEEDLQLKLNSIQDELKEHFDLIPFGIAGEILYNVSEQLRHEASIKRNVYLNEEVKEKTDKILDELDVLRGQAEGTIHIPRDTHNFYNKAIIELLKKHFFGNELTLPVNFEVIHNFSEVESKEINTMITQLKSSLRTSSQK